MRPLASLCQTYYTVRSLNFRIRSASSANREVACIHTSPFAYFFAETILNLSNVLRGHLSVYSVYISIYWNITLPTTVIYSEWPKDPRALRSLVLWLMLECVFNERSSQNNVNLFSFSFSLLT